MPVAIVTGGSRGLGRALARSLADRGWSLVIDARGATALGEVTAELPGATALAGDVADESHRRELIAAAQQAGGVDLVVNNASHLGPSPQPALAAYGLDDIRRVYEVNVFAPLALIQLALPSLRKRGGAVLNVSSDAGVEAYQGWGGYGSSKAALDHLSAILAAEEPHVRVWWVDPGDMNTQMHQAAFPGEDISDRPPPENSVPGLLHLIESHAPSGRYRAQALTPA